MITTKSNTRRQIPFVQFEDMFNFEKLASRQKLQKSQQYRAHRQCDYRADGADNAFAIGSDADAPPHYDEHAYDAARGVPDRQYVRPEKRVAPHIDGRRKSSAQMLMPALPSRT